MKSLTLNDWTAIRKTTPADEIRFVENEPGFTLEIGERRTPVGRLNFHELFPDEERFFANVTEAVPQAFVLAYTNPLRRVRNPGKTVLQALQFVSTGRRTIAENLDALAEIGLITPTAPRLWWRCQVEQAIRDGKLQLRADILLPGPKPLTNTVEPLLTPRELRRFRARWAAVHEGIAAENAKIAAQAKEDSATAGFLAAIGFETGRD